MRDDEGVYADWDALRIAVPVAVGFIVLAALGFVGFRVLRPAPELTSHPVGVDGDSPSSDQVVVLDPRSAAEVVLGEFLGRLGQGRFGGLSFAFTQPAAVEQDLVAITGNLGPHTLDPVAGPVALVDTANATAPVTLEWVLEDGTAFSTVGEVDLVLIGTEWQVDWKPSIIATTLDPGDSLVRERVVAPRAPILGRDGVALIDNRPLLEIGVVPRQVDDLTALSQVLGQLMGENGAEIRARIASSPSDSTVRIGSRTPEELAAMEAQLSGLSGVVLEPSTFPLPPNERFGRALLGRAGEVTKEIVDELPDVFVPGDIAGRSGLQREYNGRLAGLPGFQIRVKRRFPTPPADTTTTTRPGTPPTSTAPPTDDAGGATTIPIDLQDPGPQADPDVVYLSAPVEGTALQLTIDQRIQTAAEDALAGAELVSALVAIQVSTGHVLAVANGPGAAVHDFALVGQFPPGSIFKTVTAYAVMEKGFGLNDPVDCPFSLTVNGREFTNAEGEVLGTVPMWQAYVLSCNTAFINLANVLDPSDFPNTAARFGIGVGYSLGTASYSGSVPTPGGPVEKAATSFGQSRVLVSPLSAAVMAATAAGGTYRPPVLVLEPDAQPLPDLPLEPTLAADLREIMRAVVTNGTGQAVAGVAGGSVSGKTGTAEFGNQSPPQAHAWFIGFQGDLAFAAFVEGGEFGGATAAPIAAAFLNQLAS